MELTELQKMMSVGFGITITISLSLILYVRGKNKNVSYPPFARAARFILACVIAMELFRGSLHFLFPYDCHKYISGLADGFGIKDDINAMTAFALITYAWGSLSFVLAFMLMIPFIVNDSDLFITTYMLIVTLVGSVVSYVGIRSDIFTDIPKNLPHYMRDEETWENAMKSPPALHVTRLRILFLMFGVVMAIIGGKNIKKDGQHKKMN